MKFKNKEELSKAYDELEKKFTQVCQENKKLKEQVKLVEGDKIWKPKVDEKYWIVTDEGKALPFKHYCTNAYIGFGNYFKTQEEAEKQAEYNKVMNRFRKYVETHSEPLDWSNKNQAKFYLYYNHDAGTITPWSDIVSKSTFQIYASSVQILRDAVIYSAGSTKEFIRIVFNKGEK